MKRLSPRRTSQFFLLALLIFCGFQLPALATVRNVQNCGATGNGSTDDTAAINTCIGELVSGDTLEFPAGTYNVSSQLTINVSNVTVDGSSNTATIRYTSGGVGPFFVVGRATRASFGSGVALNATANEGTTSFTTVSSLGVSAGDFVLMQQGGQDYSTDTAPGHPANCDPTTACRGEVLQVQSVSGNTVTVTTMLHDTYVPSSGSVINNSVCSPTPSSGNCASAQKMLNPVSDVTVQNITFDGNSTVDYGFEINGAVNSTISGVTGKNTVGSALQSWGAFGLTWNNITVTAAGSENCGTAVQFLDQGNFSVNTMSLSSLNPGQTSGYTGCLGDGAFGMETDAAANGTFNHLTVNAAGAYGRPLKLTASRYLTFNSLTTENNAWSTNGFILNWWSSHNVFNNCNILNNGVGTSPGQGQAGINSFGNYNQYNTFNGCTVTGNANVQILINNHDALLLGQDSNDTITGNTIGGSGTYGLLVNASDACISNNTFQPGLSYGISVEGSGNIGSGNTMNSNSSNLTAGSCGGGAPTPPSGLTAAVQ